MLLYTCSRFPHSFPNAVVQTSCVAGYFANFLKFDIVSPVKGCITGGQNFCSGVVVACVGI